MKKTYSILAIFTLLFSIGRAQTIRTVAGNHITGYSGDNGPAVAAKLHGPGGVAVDAAGNMYIADQWNQVVRMVNPSGVITTLAGNGTTAYSGDGGPATSAGVYFPQDVAVDAAGNVYVVEHDHAVRKINSAGVISTVVGNGTLGYTGDGGLATNAQLNQPTDIDFDTAGNMYIADAGNNVIRKVTPGGIITTVAGNGTQGYSGDNAAATLAQLYYPVKIALDPQGNLYIADYGNSVARKVNTLGVISTFAGNGSLLDNGDGGPATSAGVYNPNGIAADAAGNVYIATVANDIRVVNNLGIISTLSGNGLAGYSGDGGPASAGQLNIPSGMNLDTLGNLYIAEYTNNVIREIGTCMQVIPQICMVEVDSLSLNNIIYWDKTPYANADTFYIYRDTANYNYALIARVPATALSMFVDTVRTLYAANGDPNITSWRYKLAYGYTCGSNRLISPTSPWHQTIYQYNIGALFIWNHYQIEGEVTPVPGLQNYLLRRDNNANGNYITAATASASSTNINDPSYATYQTTADWKVETVWGTICTPTMRYSNNGVQGAVVKARSNVKNNRTTSVHSLSGYEISAYPNPFDEAVYVYCEKTVDGMQIEILNLLGERILSSTASQGQNIIHTSQMPRGIYFIRIRNAQQVLCTSKIIKQ